MSARIAPVPPGRPSFLDVPRCESLDTLDADVAVIAFPYTVPYTIDWSRQPSSWAPGAIREASLRYPSFLTHYDMDFGAEIFAGRRIRIVDCGDVFEVAGHGEQFVHGLGHGVGIRIHEAPSMGKAREDVLPVGAIITIEPGIYIPNWGGVRIEDVGVLESDGVRVLTRAHKAELRQVAGA